MIPSASELEAWVAALETGHATTEMLPRFVAAYRRLLVQVERVRTMHTRTPMNYYFCPGCGRDNPCATLRELDALELPEPAEPPAQGALFGAEHIG